MKNSKKIPAPVTDEQQKITIVKNGPYSVTGSLPLSEMIISNDKEGYSYEWRNGKKYPLQEKYSLCRCRNAKTLPFCDGTHAKSGFDGTETANKKSYC